MANNAVAVSSNEYGKILTYSALDSLTDITAEGWFYAGSSSPYATAFSIATGSATAYLKLSTENGSPSSGVNFGLYYSGTNADGYKSSGVFDASTWVHVAIVGQENQVTKILKNGTEISSYDLQQTPSGSLTYGTAADMWVGDRYDLARPFIGAFACFRVWNYARSEAETAADLDYYLDPSKESGLVVNCNVNEGSGTVAANDVASSNDCYLYNSPSWTTGPTLSAKSYPTTETIKDTLGTGIIPFAR